MSWQDRQRAFDAIKTPPVGTKMIWIVGGGASNRRDIPIETVWFVERGSFYFIVMSGDGCLHGVLPNRLVTVSEFEGWVNEHKAKDRPLKMRSYDPPTEEDKVALQGLPERLKNQLSPKFRTRYGI